MADDIAKELVQEFIDDQDLLMSNMAALDYLSGIQGNMTNRRRMDAQVDALLKKMHGDCYEPPNEEEAPLNVLLNSIITDKDTLNQVIQSRKKNNGDNGNGSPPQARPIPRRNKLLPALLAGLLGSTLVGGPMLTYIATRPQPTPGDDANTQIILTPGDPNQIED